MIKDQNKVDRSSSKKKHKDKKKLFKKLFVLNALFEKKYC